MPDYKNKKVLFITTKNLDYLRNTQEIRLLRENGAKVAVIGSKSNNYISRLLTVYGKLLFTNTAKFDICFVGFAPQLVIPFFGWKFKKTTLVIDFFISVYDTLVFDRKKFSKKSILGKMCKRIDKKTIQRADYIISDTKAHGRYFTDEFGMDPDKHSVLYLEADNSIYYMRKSVKPERIKDKFIVMYFGSILPLQGIDIILTAVKKLELRRDIYFIIVGPIEEKEKKPILETVEYHDWLSQEKLAEYISYADLCLAGHFNADINKAKRTIPGKAYIYHAMGKPMILGDNEATHELYNEDMDGIYFVKMGDADALAEKIIEICDYNKQKA